MVQTTSHIFSGKVDIESNLLVGSSHLFVDTINNRVGITTANPDASLHVNGNVFVESNVGVGSNINLDPETGYITAVQFRGDGSNLSGVLTSLQNATDQGASSNVTINLTNEDTSLAATGNIEVGGSLIASNIETEGKIVATTFGPGNASNLTGIVTTLQSVSGFGNSTSNTILFTNTGTSLKASGTIESAGVQVNGLDVGFDRDVTSNAIRVTNIETDIGLITQNVSDLQQANTVQRTLISDLRTDVTSNTSRINSLETDRFSNTVRISLLESANIIQGDLITDIRTDITSNTSRIAVLETANTVQRDLITDIRTDITSNTSRIDALETANTVQRDLITDITLDVTSNASRIDILEYANNVIQRDLIQDLRNDLTSNTTRVETLEGANVVQESLINDLRTDLTSNTARIATNETTVSSHSGLISGLRADMNSNSARITVLETGSSTQSTDITNLQTDLSSNASRVTVLEGQRVDHENRISTLETDTASNVARIVVLEEANTVQGDLITSLRTDVTSNTSRISVLETDAASNASRVSVLELGNTVQETLINSLRVDVNSNASKLDTLTLDDVININNTTSNTVNFTNTVTGLVTAANLEIGSNLTVSGLSASKVPYVDANKVLRDSFITTTGDATVIASNLDVTGNIFMRGEKYVIESETKLINDAIIGIANNNTVATTDVGILMQRPTANVALIHHGSSDKFTIGYTQNDLEAADIVNDTVNQINVNVLGNLFTQNNLTVGSGGSYFGDGTTLTGVALKADMTSNASRIEVLETDLTSNASRVTILEAANAVQETLITNLRTDVDSNNVRITTLEAANAVQETLITNLRTDVDSNNARVTTLEAANAVQETLITNLRTDTDSNAYRVGTIETELGYPTFSTLGLDGIVNKSNATSNVIKLTNATTGLVADGNIHALNFIGDGGTLSNIATDLQQITENGNTTSNTVQFTNVVTSFITSSNVGVRVAKPEENLHLAGNLRISNTSVLSDKIDFQKIASETIFTSTPHTSWTEEQILVASNPSQHDFFGQHSAVSADGTTIAVGARSEDTTATDSGAVYVYTYGSGTWTQRVMLKASDADTDDILTEAGLGISDDGQTIVAAARQEGTGGTNAGAVYVFMAGNGTWGSHTQVKLQASNKEAGDQFARCDISGDGNVIIVGAPHEAGPTNSLQGSGAVYMFTRSGNTWSEQQIVRPHDPQVDNYFGIDCTLNRTGSVAAIAATGDDTTAADSGAVYIFKRIGGTWHQDAKLKVSSPVANNSMGSLALSDNGLTLAAGSAGDDTANSPDSGAVFVFTYAGGAWSQTIKLTGSGAGSGDNLGGRTRISGAGNTIVAGARNNDSLASDAGCAYVFAFTGGTWSEVLKITSSAGSSGDLLGDSVSISRDGTVICAGSTTADPSSTTDAGSVNVYRGSGGSVSQSTSTASFRIGDTLSIDSTTLTATGNVFVSGNVTADFLVGDGSNITGIATTLQAVSDNGNVTSNTIQFTNVTTGFITTSNIEIGGNAVITSGLNVGNVATGTTGSLQTITQNYNNLTNVPASSRASGQWRSYTFGNITLPNDWTSTGFELRAIVNGTLDGIATAEYVTITMKKQGSGTQPSVGLNFNPQNQSSGITSGGGKVYYTNVSQSSTAVSNGSFSAGDVVDFYMNIYVTYWDSLTVNFEIDYTNTVSSYGSAFVVSSVTSNVGILTNEPAFNLDVHGNANVGPLTVSNTLSLSNVATMGTTKTFVVTVSGAVYYIDGVQQPSLELHENQTYIFDMSDSTNSGHPLAFSTAYNGATSSYTTGVVSNHSTVASGTAGSKVTWTVPAGAPSAFYYYCTVHGAGMGSSTASSISPTAELIVSGRVVASGNVEADAFIGDGSQLTGISGATTSGLQVVTTNGATTSDAIQLTNTGTSLTASGGITAAYFTGDGSNVSIGEMTATTIPYVDANKQLRDSYITRTIDTTTITSNLRVEGNLVVTGTSYAVDSENMVINDRIIGLANNNTTTTLDTGLMLQYPQKNVAIIHHGTVSGSPHNGQLTIGYTQNTFVHDNIIHDANNITLNVIGHVITQNNITVGAQGSYYGDGTTLTGVALSADLSDNVTRIEDLETATIISNSSGITTGFTRGDIIYASADNVLNKLALGTSGQVLKSDGTDVVWGTDGGGGGSGSTVWQTNGNKIYYSTDNVGINVSDPAFDLDVHGTANVGALTATSLSVGGQTLALASDLSANATRIDTLYTATAGDIIYATGTNTLAKLGIGAAGQVLTVVNGFPAWAAATGGGGGGGGTSSQWTTVNTNEIYYDGNVGIANTDPGHDLSVGSNLYVDDDGSNVLVVTGNTAMSTLTLGEVSIVASYNLDQIVNTGNVTSNTVQFSNAITSLTAASNVVVTGNVTAAYFVGDGSNLTGISSTLQAITDSGNVTSNTVQFSNVITGLVTTANVEVGGELTVSGNVEVGTSNLFVDTVNSRVGIGVTSPQTNFHVESSGSTGIDVYGGDTGHPSIFIGEHMTNYSRKWGGKFTYYGDSNIRWLNVSVVDDNVETPALTIRRNAHIGINEESPETTLHITNETETTGTGDAFISGLTGNTSNRKPTECLRLQGKWYSSGSGALLRFTNQHPQGTFPNTGEYNLAGIAGYDHDSSWGGGLAFYTSPGTGSGGDDLTLRMSIDSVGAVNIPGPTTGASHGSASMLYLLDTPVIKEWQWTGSTNNTLRVTFSASELPTNCKAIYADVFMPQHSLNDHVGHALGKNHGQQTMWTGARNQQPSTTFGNLALQQCFLSMPGQSDGFEFFYGNWWNSCIIPLDTGNKLYHTVSGESGGTQSWIYMVVKGYFH